MHMYDVCKDHIGQYVSLQTVNQEEITGYIEDVDEEHVYMIVPDYGEDMMGHYYHSMGNMRRPYGYGGRPGGWWGNPGYGGPWYGGSPWYGGGYYGGYYPRPRPGFRRIALPLAALTAIAALPFI
ncbi:hypothetical protein ACFPTR_07635 [Aliibacillus thermotolerans]|uniref:Uncharacterized protein n=1 Tax=Aliibacillus thermotolerans TaxID=1834418 RepID=A0ABW0U810_9BACI|nr:hypothetical protein [Aliibacillus thermotolerans]MDA3128579.1 hypothetical protein [Aliibacillus thermotolerans]